MHASPALRVCSNDTTCTCMMVKRQRIFYVQLPSAVTIMRTTTHVQAHALLVYSCSLADRAWSDLCDALQVQYKLHAILHAVACACVLIMGLSACPDDMSHNNMKCFTKTFPGVALASVMPSLVLYFVEAWHRKHFLRSQKTA